MYVCHRSLFDVDEIIFRCNEKCTTSIYQNEEIEEGHSKGEGQRYMRKYIYIDRVWFREIFGDQGHYIGQL